MTSSPPSSTTVSTDQPSPPGVMEQPLNTACTKEHDSAIAPTATSSSNLESLPSEDQGSEDEEDPECGNQSSQTQQLHGTTSDSRSIGNTSQTVVEKSPIHPLPVHGVESSASFQAGDVVESSDTRSERSQLQPLAPAPLNPSSLSTLGLDPDTATVFGLLPVSSLENISMIVAGDHHPVIHTIQETKKNSPSESPTNIPSKNASPKSTGSNLRRGKWTVEEESYVARVIQDFNSGFLDAPAGTTLRSYLSEKLQCDPMRITKKFTGEACIGKRVFHPAVRSATNASAIDKAQAELDTLERRWRRRLEMQQRESAKKAAASAAAASTVGTVVGSRGTTNHQHTMIQGVPVALLSSGVNAAEVTGTQIGRSVVTQAASWLDRANAILKGVHIHGTSSVMAAMPHSFSTRDEKSTDGTGDSTPDSTIENEMKEVERLIHEGPRIQKTAAGLPNLLTSHNQRLRGDLEGPPSPPEPADKRMRTGTGGTISGAEDAEALVGFLRSVRAATRQDTS